MEGVRRGSEIGAYLSRLYRIGDLYLKITPEVVVMSVFNGPIGPRPQMGENYRQALKLTKDLRKWSDRVALGRTVKVDGMTEEQEHEMWDLCDKVYVYEVWSGNAPPTRVMRYFFQFVRENKETV
jgi:hypothetical protein